MKIKAVLFDIGDVLEICPPTGMDKRWEIELGMEQGSLLHDLDDVYQAGSIGALTIEQMSMVFRQRLGMNEEQLVRFWEDIWEQYLGSPNEELIEYFSNLRTRVRTGIISNSGVGCREKEQERYGFGDMCELIVYSHEEGILKPDRRIYDITCERMNLRPTEAVFVDDMEENIVAANELGFHGILHIDNKQTIARIEAILKLS